MGKRPTRCIFCNEPKKLSKEHLWSKWTRQLVKHDALQHEHKNQVFRITGIDRTERTYGGDARNRGIRAVCKECNSGWMSSIEEWARPALEPLIKGEHAFLDHDSQRAVATWIAMKAMVAEYFDPSRVAIPLSERQFLRDHRKPPEANWRIWIGNFARDKWAGHWAHSYMGIAPLESIANRPPEVANTQTTTFVVGKLYAHIFSSEIVRLVEMAALGRRTLILLAQAWPIREDFIAWPTSPMNDTDADKIAVAIFNDLRTRYPSPG
jgi:hypothetical protein